MLPTIFRLRALAPVLLTLLVLATAAHADQPPNGTGDCDKTDTTFPYADTQPPGWVTTTSAGPGILAWVCINRLPGATPPYDPNDPTDYDQADRQAEFAALHSYVEYRPTGTGAWLRTDETAWNAGAKAMTGLQPDTEYEYRMVVRSDLYPERGWHTDSQTVTFRTAAAPQPTPTREPSPQPTPSPTPNSSASGNQSTPAPQPQGNSASHQSIPVPQPQGNGDATDLLLACSKKPVVLTDVHMEGRHVRLTGAADKRLAGRPVELRYRRTGKAVARARVAADGSFKATAELPPRRDRGTNRARYVATVGKERSSALKLTRRLWLTKASSSHGKLTFTGRVTGRVAKPRRVTVTRRVTCQRYELVRTFKLPANGRFRVKVPAPARQSAAVYRLTAKVRGRGAKPVRTYTLPVAVNIADVAATSSAAKVRGPVPGASGRGEGR